jgi:hypothetical protein
MANETYLSRWREPITAFRPSSRAAKNRSD